jgi:hypothetical protein
MSYDPLTLLILKYRGQSIAVIRENCLRHEVSRAARMPHIEHA